MQDLQPYFKGIKVESSTAYLKSRKAIVFNLGSFVNNHKVESIGYQPKFIWRAIFPLINVKELHTCPIRYSKSHLHYPKYFSLIVYGTVLTSTNDNYSWKKLTHLGPLLSRLKQVVEFLFFRLLFTMEFSESSCLVFLVHLNFIQGDLKPLPYLFHQRLSSLTIPRAMHGSLLWSPLALP